MPLYFSVNSSVNLASFIMYGDNESSPGPQKSKKNSLSICHWNLNSLSANSFAKFTQLEAYNSVDNYDFICLSETCFDSATPKYFLEIECYNLVRADHLNNVKRGGVCIYFKESLPARAINLPYFNEVPLSEMSHNNKNGIISVIYRSPSQNNNEFDLFLSNFENLVIDKKKVVNHIYL